MRQWTGFNATGAGVVAALLLLLAAPASATPAAASTLATKSLSAGDVVKAFGASGIKLFNPLLGVEQPVVTLTASNSPGPYVIGVSIYLTPKRAIAVFKGEKPSWVASGFAVALRGNVVITVVPKGAALGRKHAPFAMPAPVAKSIGILTADLSR